MKTTIRQRDLVGGLLREHFDLVQEAEIRREDLREEFEYLIGQAEDPTRNDADRDPLARVYSLERGAKDHFEVWKEGIEETKAHRLICWVRLCFEVFLKEWILLVLVLLLPYNVVFTTTNKNDIFDSCKSLTFYSSVFISAKFLIMDIRLKRLQFQPIFSICPVILVFFVLPNLVVISVTSRLSFFGAVLLFTSSLLETLVIALYNSFFILRMRSKCSLMLILAFLLGGVWLSFWINGPNKGGR